MTDFAIFEFSGLPKSGKSTVIEIVSTHLRRSGYNVQVFQDTGTYAPIGKNNLGELNMYLANCAVNAILEIAYSKARLPTILLVDRGIFDRCTFSKTLFQRSHITEEEHHRVIEYLKIDSLTKLISGVFVFSASVECVMRREMVDALNSTKGDVMNASFLQTFKAASEELSRELDSNFQNIEVIDTERLDGRIRETARLVSISVERSLNRVGFVDPKVPRPVVERHGDFLVCLESDECTALPYYLCHQDSEYTRYMDCLYTPKLPSEMTTEEAVALCEIRNKYPNLTIDTEFNRDVVEVVAKYVISRPTFNTQIDILDFGCGDGRSMELLIEKFPAANLMGFDPGERSIQQAKKKGLDVIQFTSESDWGLNQIEFDLITAFFVMHFSIPLADLITLRSMTRKGGEFFFNIYNGNLGTLVSNLLEAGWSNPVELQSDQSVKGHRVYRSEAI